MKKFINNTETIVEEMIEGYVHAYQDRLEKLDGAHVILRKEPKDKGNVSVIIGNGSGHEPACIGFVGQNMLDANAYGGLFAAPSPDVLYDAIEATDKGCRGLCLDFPTMQAM